METPTSETSTYVPTSTSTPIATRTPRHTPVNGPTSSPSCPSGAIRVAIRIEGQIDDALKGESGIAWDAVEVDCKGEDGEVLPRVEWNQDGSQYCLPGATVSIQLWIGDELGGQGWWTDWDSQPMAVKDGDNVTLRIAKRDAPPPAGPGPTVTP